MCDLKNVLIKEGFIKEGCTIDSEILIETLAEGMLNCDVCGKCFGNIQNEIPSLLEIK